MYLAFAKTSIRVVCPGQNEYRLKKNEKSEDKSAVRIILTLWLAKIIPTTAGTVKK